MAAAAAWVASAPALAGPLPWPTSQFSYPADGKPLHQVLSEFAAGFSLSLDMPTGLDAPVHGRLSGLSATEFIERLAGIYGFNWFTHAGTLHISGNKDMVVRTLPSASAGSGIKLRQLLTELRVLDPRFGWGELPDQGMVVVSGPPAYVRLIEATVAAIPSMPGDMQVNVFRLKHASAEDRAITFRDRQIVTPGVATILRNLVSGNTELALPSLGLIGNPAAVFSATAPAAGGKPGAMADQGSRSTTGGSASNDVGRGPNDSVSGKRSTGIRPSIQSDARLNAIIVQDVPERLPIYQQLIAKIDVPTSLIEIEAMIIDVNTNRLEELGISWHAVGLSGGLSSGMALGYVDANKPIDGNTLSLSAGPSGTGANSATIVANAARHFVSRLRMLEQQGDASIHARPSILTTENIGAVIDLSETFYIQTTSERSALVTPITAGTTLRITPRLEGAGDQTAVRLNVDIEDEQIQASSTAGGTPSVKRGVVSTEASVRKDESLLLGGYSSVQTIKGKVPLLGDLPLLGAMFSGTANQTQRRERLFLIRTKVLGSPPASVAGAVAPVLLPTTALPEVGTPAPAPAAAPSPALAAATAEIRASLSSAPETAATPPPPAAPALSAPAVVPTSADAKGSSPRLDVGKSRDRDARRILRAELERAEQDLAARRERLSAGFDPSNPDERAANALARAATVRAQSDIKALRRELSRLPGAAAAPR